jgi:outer membrane protein OmpA-like peptidoglycan-associated protein
VARAFDVHFPFETSVNFKTPNALRDVLAYAEAVGATRIEVTGHRAAVRLSDGSILEERPGLAARRAREVAGMFHGLVPTVERIEQVVDESAEPGDWRDRKVTITVYP